MNATRKSIALAALSLAIAPLAALAQQQVDPQVGQVDPRVGGELYGNNPSGSRLVLPQQRLLPSEERDAITRSGALPSEVNLAREAAGPLTPNGVIDYLPRRSPLQAAMGLPSARLYNPAYDASFRRDQRIGQQPSPYQPLSGYPQNAREGIAASTRIPGALNGNRPAVRPTQQPQQQQPAPVDTAVAGLTPAPDRALPTGQLSDDVKYDPNSTPGARFLNRQLPKVVPPATGAKPAKPPSLADEEKKQQRQGEQK